MPQDNFDCPITGIIDPEAVSGLSEKQTLELRESYCINTCTVGCDSLIVLKKILWNLRNKQ